MSTTIHQVHRDQKFGPITRLQLNKNGGAMTDTEKRNVIASIRSGEIVETAGQGQKAGTRVRVIEANPPYLRTDANGTEADNLGGLPTY